MPVRRKAAAWSAALLTLLSVQPAVTAAPRASPARVHAARAHAARAHAARTHAARAHAVRGRAQEDALPSGATRARPVGRALRVATAPTIDGVVAGEAVWQDAEPLTGFTQTTPDEGQPASERTEVRVVFTDEALFFGVICFDTDPTGIVVADTRRDSSLDETDSFRIILDPHRDEQNGWVFGTSPSGLQYDGQVNRSGQGGGPGGRGSGGGFNLNWDGSWEVATQVTGQGWTAEFAIPFRTLRYPSGPIQTWGINLQRNIRRRNEEAFWARLPRQLGLFRLSLAGTLTDLEPPEQRNFKVTPYVLAERSRGGDAGDDTDTAGEVGVDAKLGLTPSVTLDLTYNTDFAQVEVDEQQVNITRFNLFFPEKRPFFLENAGTFSVGRPGQVELFFSRRIGLDAGGGVVPILGGARVSGKVGHTNLGFLDMETDRVRGVVDRNNFGVVRISHDLRNRTSFGGLFTNRQGADGLTAPDDFNRVWAVDGRKGIGEFGDVSGFAARSISPGIEQDAYAFNASGRYDSEKWLLSLQYTEVGEGFNPEMGFLQRTAFRSPDALIFRRIRPVNHPFGLQELRPHASYRGFWDFDGFQETGFLHLDNHWEWQNGNEIHTGVNFTLEGLKAPFEIFPGIIIPPGTYRENEVALVGFTNRGAPVGFELRTTIGGFFGGHRITATPSIRARAGEKFNTTLSWEHNDIELPFGNFETNLARLRASYSFDPTRFLQALIQYNDREDVWSSNLRFGWLQTANVGLFVVYNESRGFNGGGPFQTDRSLTVKASWQFDLLR
ncbi:MAG: DUF5916 domain-containing protein [Acidobacteriota bacterium]